MPGPGGDAVHGTIQARPAEVFRVEELPCLAPASAGLYDVPIYATAKVHRDHHIEVAKALYSIPGNLIGTRVEVRADRVLVRIYARGQVVKVHPRQPPGGRVTDPDDLPSERTAYAMRDLDALRRVAVGHGPAIGVFVDALLDNPLPWTKMRQVYALHGLVKKWGPDRVNTACASALEHEAVNVGLIGRMLERATENTPGIPAAPAPAGEVITPRFARQPDGFAAWYRNPLTSSQDSLAVAYEHGGRVRTVRPDFVFFSEEPSGSIVATIVDPHGHHLGDALPKLRGLADYAEQHAAHYQRIEAVSKVGEVLRVLDLTAASVRKAIQDAPDATSLYRGEHAATY